MKATRRIKSVEERFYPRLAQRPNGCIEWTGAIDHGGYGLVGTGPVFSPQRIWLAHRLAWTLARGPIPDGLHVLHRCDNRPCCNVEHLFLGTHQDNMADMARKGRRRGTSSWCAAVTHCPQGHPYDEANTYRDRHGWRYCRTCKKAKDAGRRR